MTKLVQKLNKCRLFKLQLCNYQSKTAKYLQVHLTGSVIFRSAKTLAQTTDDSAWNLELVPFLPRIPIIAIDENLNFYVTDKDGDFNNTVKTGIRNPTIF